MTVCDTTSKTPIRHVIRNSHSLLKLQGKLYQITLKIIMCTRYWIETHGTPSKSLETPRGWLEVKEMLNI